LQEKIAHFQLSQLLGMDRFETDGILKNMARCETLLLRLSASCAEESNYAGRASDAIAVRDARKNFLKHSPEGPSKCLVVGLFFKPCSSPSSSDGERESKFQARKLGIVRLRIENALPGNLINERHLIFPFSCTLRV